MKKNFLTFFTLFVFIFSVFACTKEEASNNGENDNINRKPILINDYDTVKYDKDGRIIKYIHDIHSINYYYNSNNEIQRKDYVTESKVTGQSNFYYNGNELSIIDTFFGQNYKTVCILNKMSENHTKVKYSKDFNNGFAKEIDSGYLYFNNGNITKLQLTSDLVEYEYDNLKNPFYNNFPPIFDEYLSSLKGFHFHSKNNVKKVKLNGVVKEINLEYDNHNRLITVDAPFLQFKY